MENKLHYGTKAVRLTPMTRGEYNAFRGWAVPENEDPSDPGYRVEYMDGGKPNVEGFKGYISWSPKEQADNAYVSEDVLTANGGKYTHTVGGATVTYTIPVVQSAPEV